VLWRHLPASLSDFKIKLEFCKHISDAGFSARGSQLPPGHAKLDFNFGETSIGDGEIQALGAHLPADLSQLTINLGICKRISDAGVSALGSHLPSGLAKLDLGFKFTSIGDDGRSTFGLAHYLGLLLFCSRVLPTTRTHKVGPQFHANLRRR